MEVEILLIKTLVNVASQNRWAALGLGIVFALYLLGRFGGDEPVTDWEFSDPDEAIAFYEKRIEVLKQIRAKRQNNTSTAVLNTLRHEIRDLQAAIDALQQEAETPS